MISRRGWVLLAGGGAVMACAAQASNNAAASELDLSPAEHASLSQQHARHIEALEHVELPDGWYRAQGASMTERFQAAFEGMARGPDKPASAVDLMARYANQGQPVVHAVWFNRPLRCALCRGAGADGFRTLLAVRLGLTLTVTAQEMHLVTEHGASFPEAKLATLSRMFEAPVARP